MTVCRLLRLCTTTVFLLLLVSGNRIFAAERLHAAAPGGEGNARVIPVLSGFSYRVYEGDRLVNELAAESLNVQPRRVLFFNVSRINELALNGARFDVYLQEGVPTDSDPFSVLEKSVAGSEHDRKGRKWPEHFGVITRQVVNGLVHNIYRDGEPVMEVRADSVRIDRDMDDPEYLHVTLTDVRTGRTISCEKAVFNRKENRFEIPGSFVLAENGHERKGRGIRVDYGFSLQAL